MRIPSLPRAIPCLLLLSLHSGCAHTGPSFSQRQGEWLVSWSGPAGQHLHSVWVDAAGDAWAAGDAGSVVRFRRQQQGVLKEVLDTGNGAHLLGVWGASGDDVWAVGVAGTILHFDGRRWTRSPTPFKDRLAAVWGSGPNDVWAVGMTCEPQGTDPGYLFTGTIWHWAGQRWSVVARHVDRPFAAVGGRGPRDVHVGGNGFTWRFDGQQWFREALGPLEIEAIGSGGLAEVWAVGGDALAARWDGVAWTLAADEAGNVTSLAVVSANERWIIAGGRPKRFLEGQGRPSEMGEGASWNAVGARPGGPVWVVGADGQGALWDPVNAGRSP